MNEYQTQYAGKWRHTLQLLGYDFTHGTFGRGDGLQWAIDVVAQAQAGLVIGLNERYAGLGDWMAAHLAASPDPKERFAVAPGFENVLPEQGQYPYMPFWGEPLTLDFSPLSVTVQPLTLAPMPEHSSLFFLPAVSPDLPSVLTRDPCLITYNQPGDMAQRAAKQMLTAYWSVREEMVDAFKSLQPGEQQPYTKYADAFFQFQSSAVQRFEYFAGMIAQYANILEPDGGRELLGRKTVVNMLMPWIGPPLEVTKLLLRDLALRGRLHVDLG